MSLLIFHLHTLTALFVPHNIVLAVWLTQPSTIYVLQTTSGLTSRFQPNQQTVHVLCAREVSMQTGFSLINKWHMSYMLSRTKHIWYSEHGTYC